MKNSETVKPDEEIVKILSKSSTPIRVNPTKSNTPKRMTQQDLNQRLNLILSDD